MKKYLLPEKGQFYKANLHCHSTVSDGRWSPERLKEEYMARGYSVIAYTDHDVLIPHQDLTDARFVALNGYEMEIDPEPSEGRRSKCCHICLIALDPENTTQVCWHRSRYVFGNALDWRDKVRFREEEPDYVRCYSHAGISDMMRRGREAGFFVTYNHPVWSLEDRRDYSGYEGMHAMEVCNWGCVVDGYDDYVPQVYDDLLRQGKRICCIGTDDNHNAIEDSFGAFTVIKAPELSYRAITQALEDGHFYASQGPEIHELWVEDGYIHIRCSEAWKIDCSFDIRAARCALSKDGVPLVEASFLLPKDAAYVRLTVTDRNGSHANTNAYWLDEIL